MWNYFVFGKFPLGEKELGLQALKSKHIYGASLIPLKLARPRDRPGLPDRLSPMGYPYGRSPIFLFICIKLQTEGSVPIGDRPLGISPERAAHTSMGCPLWAAPLLAKLGTPHLRSLNHLNFKNWITVWTKLTCLVRNCSTFLHIFLSPSNFPIHLIFTIFLWEKCLLFFNSRLDIITQSKSKTICVW